MADETTRFRLVMCQYRVRRGVTGVLGLLYPLDAGRWSQPAWSFRMAPTEPFLPVPAGGVVELDRAPHDGAHVRVASESHSFRTSQPVRRGAPDLGGRMFAQHGDEVLHPALGGRMIGTGDDEVRLRNRFRRDVIIGVVGFAVGIALLVLAVAAEQRGRPFGRLWGTVIGFLIGGPLVIAVAIKHRLELRQIQQATAGPGRSMVMRLGWVVGTGSGAVAVVELRRPGSSPGAGVEQVLGVVNVPPSLVELEPRDLDCVVYGDLARGIVAIEVEGTTMYPATGRYRIPTVP